VPAGKGVHWKRGMNKQKAPYIPQEMKQLSEIKVEGSQIVQGRKRRTQNSESENGQS